MFLCLFPVIIIEYVLDIGHPASTTIQNFHILYICPIVYRTVDKQKLPLNTIHQYLFYYYMNYIRYQVDPVTQYPVKSGIR
jgi:hypothetical protein